MKQRFDTVNSKLGSLETRIDTMSRDQAESSCTIQSKLGAILRNSTSQDKLVTDRTQGNRVDFVEPQRNKRESTALPLPRVAASTGPGGPRQGGHFRMDCPLFWEAVKNQSHPNKLALAAVHNTRNR